MARSASRDYHGTSRVAGLCAGRDRPAWLPTGEPVRAFVALNFPDAVRRGLWDALAPVRERREQLPVKWVRPENIHLSLKFLGDVDESQEAELVAALKQAAGTRAAGLSDRGASVSPTRDAWARRAGCTAARLHGTRSDARRHRFR